MTDLSEAERQLLLAAGWLRSRYGLMAGLGADARSDRPTLEEFGRTWMGAFMADWSAAYASLTARGLLSEAGGEYALTDEGQAARRALEVEHPFWLYEYDNFFASARASRAHSRFCERVYGRDLCQHGLADVAQLEVLLDMMALSPGERALDLGCGSGLITEYLSDRTGAAFTGLDISREAVRQARERTAGKAERLSFEAGNMNRLALPDASFDAAVSIDTLYYVDSLEETLRQVARVLKPGGRLGVFYTQWVVELEEAARLRPEGTDLAVALRRLGLKFTAARDLTREEAEHWRRKLGALEEMRPEFEREGSLALHAYRHTEAARYAAWDLRKRSRHLYLVKL